MGKHSLRIEYGKYLVELGHKNKNIVALEADLKESTQSIRFEEAFPDRYIEVGVAEQNMVGIATGLALGGKIPIVHSFACFISMRSCEQVRTTVAYPKLNVKFVVTHAGISTGTAGPTHHSIEDIAIMRAIPNMKIIAPGDVIEMKQAVAAAITVTGPVYIRLGAGEAEEVYGKNTKFSIGKATLIKEGHDATIITTGTLMHDGLLATEILKRKYDLNVRLLQMACIKPLDKEAVVKALKETGVIITAEEHNVFGGLGGAVCEVAAELGKGRVKRIGIRDRFCEFGSTAFLMKKEKINKEEIVKQVLKLARQE